MPRPVLDAMKSHLDLESRIGGYEAEAFRQDAIREAYRWAGDLIHSSASNIGFTSSATDSFARAISSIPFEFGDSILTTENDYISNQIAFLSLSRRLGVKIIRAADVTEGGVDVDSMAKLMDSHRPKVVTVTHVPTNSGLVQPVEAVGKLCRERDITYIVDACQSVGQLPVDVEKIGCDFLSATCRKFLRGPRGSGFLYVSDRALNSGLEPLFIDMRGADWIAENQYKAAKGAQRFEEWESSYALILGAGEAFRYALNIGIDRISTRTLMLASQIREKAARMPGVKVLDLGKQRCGIVTLQIPGREETEFKSKLDAANINTNITRRQYAVIDFDRKGVDWALRVSPHYYNTEEEIDQFIAVLSQILSDD